MPALVFVAPLRLAVRGLARKGQPFTVDALAIQGRATGGAALAYGNRLTNQGVLVRRPDCRYQAGIGFAAWMGKKPKTRPGGHRLERYRAIPATAIA